MKRGKRYKEAAARVDRTRYYLLEDGIQLLHQLPMAKFDETVECAVRLGVDPRHADQMVRSTVVLPQGTGRKIRVLVFAKGEHEVAAREAGADYVGAEDLVEKIQGGWIEFDVAIATPDMMKIVGRLGKILGSRGLMPNPKSGTIVPAADLPRVIRDARKGRVEFRVDRTGQLHLPLGKVSFEQDKLVENMATAVDAIVKAKPSGAKGQYVRGVTLTTSMGPGIKLDVQRALSLAAATA